MKVNEKDLKRYIEKVISEAAVAENRENDVQYQYLIIDNDLLFAVKSKYRRILRKIGFRLFKNLERNFGLHFNFVYSNLFVEFGECFRSSVYSICDQKSAGIDPNHSFVEWDCLGRKVTITYAHGIRPKAELGLPHLMKLKVCGYNYETDMWDWNTFKTAYEKAYGETPMEGFKKIKKLYDKKMED